MKRFNVTTVENLIGHLKKLPADMEVSICGTPGYLFLNEEKNYISFDYDYSIITEALEAMDVDEDIIEPYYDEDYEDED